MKQSKKQPKKQKEISAELRARISLVKERFSPRRRGFVVSKG